MKEVKKTKKIEIDKDELYDLYWNKKKSQPEIAKYYGVSIGLINKRMREFNISSRTLAQSQLNYLRKNRKTMIYINKNWLYEQYWTKEKSSIEMGKMCGVDSKTIFYWMEKHNIPKREKSYCSILGNKKVKKYKKRCLYCKKVFTTTKIEKYWCNNGSYCYYNMLFDETKKKDYTNKKHCYYKIFHYLHNYKLASNKEVKTAFPNCSINSISECRLKFRKILKERYGGEK